jgi:hypothetical protein
VLGVIRLEDERSVRSLLDRTRWPFLIGAKLDSAKSVDPYYYAPGTAFPPYCFYLKLDAGMSGHSIKESPSKYADVALENIAQPDGSPNQPRQCLG